jgi:hypothetical protein
MQIIETITIIILILCYLILCVKKPTKKICKDCPYKNATNSNNFDMCMYCEFGR